MTTGNLLTLMKLVERTKYSEGAFIEPLTHICLFL